MSSDSCVSTVYQLCFSTDLSQSWSRGGVIEFFIQKVFKNCALPRQKDWDKTQAKALILNTIKFLINLLFFLQQISSKFTEAYTTGLHTRVLATELLRLSRYIVVAINHSWRLEVNNYRMVNYLQHSILTLRATLDNFR